MKRSSLWISSLALAISLSAGLGCASKPDDAKISGEIQSKFSQDSGLSTKQLNVQASAGVVTLAGNVDNDAQREAAGRQAASVAGVKTVINNLIVGNAPAPAVVAETSRPVTPPPTSTMAPDKAKPAPSKKSKTRSSDNSAGNSTSDPQAGPTTADNSGQPAATPYNTPTAPPAAQPAAQTPPPPPAPKKLIIDQGTQVTVRLIDPIDSEKNQTGDTFHATLNSPLSSDGEVAVPAGTELTGHLVSVKSAGKFAGQSEVVLQLDSISSGGQTYNLQTDQYKKTGSSRGKNTAEKVGAAARYGGGADRRGRCGAGDRTRSIGRELSHRYAHRRFRHADAAGERRVGALGGANRALQTVD